MQCSITDQHQLPIENNVNSWALPPQSTDSNYRDQEIETHDTDGRIVLEFMNVTSAKNAIPFIATRQAHIVALAEHSIAPSKIAELKQDLAEQEEHHAGVKTWHFGPTDEHAATQLGGLAMGSRSHTIIPFAPRTEQYKKVLEKGRALIYLIAVSAHLSVYVAVFYGKTGGHQDKSH